MKRTATIAAASLLLAAAVSFAQATAPASPAPAAAKPAPVPQGVTPPDDYVIGVADVLHINYWMEPEMTADYVVRPDGVITLPLLNDVPAEGLKPEQLRLELLKRSTQFKDPQITVVVKAINSRKVFIEGAVNKPGPYDLSAPLTVMSLISIAGSLREFTSGKNIVILRKEGGKQVAIKFNYEDVRQGKRLEQNIPLKPGDIVVVPE
jgi:polysaccharide export outer membrane protein